MSLTKIKLNATNALEKIGKTNGTAPQESTDNRHSIAHEFFISDIMRSYSNKRYENAKKEAEKAGLLLQDEPVAGTTTETYANEHLSVAAKVTSPRTQINETLLRLELIKAYGEAVASKIIEKAKSDTKPPTSYLFIEK